MGSLKEVQLIGCLGHHGPYSFYKNVKINGRVLGLSSFFPVRIYPDSAIFSIAEVQLLWSDRAENFVSLRLYFLPENTPDGRLRHHGEDEVIALQDKVIIRASDLSSWLVDDSEWDWGYVIPPLVTKDSSSPPLTPTPEHPKRAFSTDKFIKSDRNRDTFEIGSSRIVVLNYQRYVRIRTLLKRLEGSEDVSNWLSDPLVLALGGLANIGTHCRLLFSKEVFDYPELEDHELLCNHLAPKLKGRPRKRKRKRDRSVGSESNRSSSSATSACSFEVTKEPLNGVIIPPGCPVELEKPQVNCSSPKSVGSEESQPSPESPDDKVTTVTSENPISEPTRSSPNEIKAEPSTTSDVDTAVPAPPKNGQFHHEQSKKRKGNRLHQKLTPQETLPVEPKIELESTTIKVTSSPPPVSTSPGPPISTSPTPSLPKVMKESELCHSSTSPTPELLEPSLVELAEKLEKSNALQILPIRPSVITKQEPTSCDMESSYNGPSPSPSKKPRIDLIHNRTSPFVTVSEVPFSTGKGNNLRIGATSGPPWKDGMSPPGEADGTRPNPIGSYKNLPPSWTKGNVTNSETQQSNTNIQPAHQGSLASSVSTNSKCNNSESLPGKTALSITAIETDSRRKTVVYPMAWGSPSAFLPTRRIYGDPSPKVLMSMSRTQQPKQSNGITGSTTHSEGALDFSVKRRKLCSDSASQPSSQNPNPTLNLDAECLDLSLHKSPPSSISRQVYHAISDIPPPNAVNHQGLRLTSEVTLFPSPHQQQQQQKQSRRASPQVQVKRTDKVKGPQNDKFNSIHPMYNSHPFPAGPPQTHLLDTKNLPNSANTASRQRHLPNEPPPPPPKRGSEFHVGGTEPPPYPGSGRSIISANNYNQSNPHSKPRVWKSTAPASTVSTPGAAHGNSSSSSGRNSRGPISMPVSALNNHHSNNKQPKSNRTRSPAILDQRMPGPGYHSVSPPQPSPNQSGRGPPLANQRHRQPSEDTRERNRGHNLEHLPQASPFGNFVLPTPSPVFSYSYPNLDPSFFSSHFGSPFAMNPNLMRLPPGTMESLQMAHYLQQGMSPHMNNWPGPPLKEESRNGQH